MCHGPIGSSQPVNETNARTHLGPGDPRARGAVVAAAPRRPGGVGRREREEVPEAREERAEGGGGHGAHPVEVPHPHLFHICVVVGIYIYLDRDGPTPHPPISIHNDTNPTPTTHLPRLGNGQQVHRLGRQRLPLPRPSLLPIPRVIQAQATATAAPGPGPARRVRRGVRALEEGHPPAPHHERRAEPKARGAVEVDGAVLFEMKGMDKLVCKM